MQASQSTLDAYLSEIARYPLLSREEEAELGRRLRDTGDPRARQRLVTSNLRFVVSVAKKYRRYGLPLQDLIQEGNLGLMRAIEKFDPDRGVRLVSYARWWIRAFIQSFVLRSWSVVRVGGTRADRRLFFALSRAQQAIGQSGLDAGLDEERIAAEVGLTPEAVRQAAPRVTARDTSLDIVATDDGHDSLVALVDDGSLRPEDLVEREESRRQIAERIDAEMALMDGRTRRVFERRVLEEDPVPLRTLGSELDLSREGVRQIQMKSLRRLRSLLGEFEDYHPADGRTPHLSVLSG